MKRRKLERHLRDHGCRLFAHGAGHDRWHSPDGKIKTTVPRHTDIPEDFAKLICRQLGVAEVRGD